MHRYVILFTFKSVAKQVRKSKVNTETNSEWKIESKMITETKEY